MWESLNCDSFPKGIGEDSTQVEVMPGEKQKDQKAVKRVKRT